MGAFDGFEVMEIPTRRSSSSRGSGEVIDAFLASGEECMGKDFGDEKEAMRTYGAYNNFIMRNSYPVKVVKRGTVIRLVRK